MGLGGSSSDTLDTLGRVNRPPGPTAIHEMDTVQMELHVKEDLKSSFSDASSDQAVASHYSLRGSLPQVEHVHSIEPTTLLWLLLVYVAVRISSPLLRDRAQSRRNGNGEGVDGAQVASTKLKPKPKPRARQTKEGQ